MKNALYLHEFVVFKSKLPSSKTGNAVERSLAKFIARSRKAKWSSRWKHALLDRSLRRFNLVTGKDIRSGWSHLFDQWRLSTSTKESLDFADPVSNRNYIPRGCSPEEHMVRQMGVSRYFEPDECLEENIPAGDMRDVFSYVVADDRRAEVVPCNLLACSSQEHN